MALAVLVARLSAAGYSPAPLISRSAARKHHARMAKLVYARDLKSLIRKGMRVRPPLRAPIKMLIPYRMPTPPNPTGRKYAHALDARSCIEMLCRVRSTHQAGAGGNGVAPGHAIRIHRLWCAERTLRKPGAALQRCEFRFAPPRFGLPLRTLPRRKRPVGPEPGHSATAAQRWPDSGRANGPVAG